MFLYELKEEEKHAFAVVARELIQADNNIAEEEEYYLSLFKDEMGLDEIPDDMTSEKAVEIFKAADSSTKKEIYMELYALAKCDHEYDDSERRIMNFLAVEMQITEDKREELEKIVDDFTGLYIRINRVLADD